MVHRYEVGVGSLPGGTEIYDFHPVASTSHRHLVISGIDLGAVREVYVTVKGYNEAGHYSTATSNGVFISRVSAGLPSLGRSYVYDGMAGDDL